MVGKRLLRPRVLCSSMPCHGSPEIQGTMRHLQEV